MSGFPAPDTSPHRTITFLTAILLILLPTVRAPADSLPDMQIQLGHSLEVDCVRFSPDGRYLVSAGLDDSISLWNMRSGKEMRKLVGHLGLVYAAAFLRDGRTVISSGHDGTIRLWDAATGAALDGFRAGGFHVLSMAVSPHGNSVLCGCSNGAIFLLDPETGRITREFAGHASHVSVVRFSDDGSRFLSGGGDAVVKLWEVDKREPVRVFLGHTLNVFAVGFSPDGRQIVSGAGFMNRAELKVWDTESGRLVRDLIGHEGCVNFTEFSPEGRVIISGGDDGTIRYWGVDDGAQLQVSRSPGSRIKTASLSPDGAQLVTAGGDSAIYQWDRRTGKLVRRIGGTADPVETAAFSPDDRLIATAAGSSISVWDRETAARVRVLTGHEREVSSVRFSTDGRRILSGSFDRTAKLWDVSSGRLLRTFGQHPDFVLAVAFSRDGRSVYTASRDGEVKVWDAESGRELRSYRAEEKESSFCFSDDGSLVVSRVMESLPAQPGSGMRAVVGRLTLRESDSGKELGRYRSDSYLIGAMSISPDNSRILVGLFDGSVVLWEPKSGSERKLSGGHSAVVTSLGFSRDGRLALSGGRDAGVLLWDVAAGRELGALGGHLRTVNSVAISADSRFALSAGDDAQTVLRDLRTGHSTSLVSSADGRDWIAYTEDGYWDSSVNGGRLVAMVSAMDAWNVDQFAARCNRPEILLERTGSRAEDLARHFHALHLKRLRRLGVTEEALESGWHVPEAHVLDSVVSGRQLRMRIRLSDSLVDLASYTVYINDVPLFGSVGKPLSGRDQTVEETIELACGVNKVEVSCRNAKGVESYRTLSVTEVEENRAGDLYFLGFGISDYGDVRLNLSFPHKDVKDLADLFSAMQSEFRNIHVRTWLNDAVTPQNISAAKRFLSGSGVDDTYVLFIAGHGLHDDDPEATYYYLTYGADPDNLRKTAADFELVEELLQGVPPLRKLFLIDTCESGEVEPGEAALMEEASARGIRSRSAARGGNDLHRAAEDERLVGLRERNRFIYNDLVRRSGAIVFSSSRGNESSYESEEIQNGFFTEAILRAIGAGAADADGDGTVSTDELRMYVSEWVSNECMGLQNPTVDRDNLEQKFGFPVAEKRNPG